MAGSIDPLSEEQRGAVDWFAEGSGAIALGEFLPEQIKIGFERTAPRKPPGMMGWIGAFDLDEILEYGGPEEFMKEFWGGGTYRVRLRKSGGFMKGVRERGMTIAGSAISKEEGEAALSIARGEEQPDATDEDDGVVDPRRTSAWAQMVNRQESPFFRGAGGGVAPPAPAAADPSNIISALEGFNSRRDDSLMQVLVALLSKPNEPREADPMIPLLLDEVRESRKPGTEVEMLLKGLEKVQTMQSTAMTQTYKMLTETAGKQVEASAAMNAEALKGFMSMMGQITKAALASKEDGSFADSLPELLSQFMAPFGGGGGVPGALQPRVLPPALTAGGPPDGGAPGQIAAPSGATSGQTGTAEGAPPPPAPAGELPAMPAGDQAGMVGTAATYDFLASLKSCILAQPDVDATWDELMEQKYRMLPVTARDAIEALDPSEYDKIAEILGTVAGVDPKWIEDVIGTAAATKGGFPWLAEFWEVAPWTLEDEEEEEEPAPALPPSASSPAPASESGPSSHSPEESGEPTAAGETPAPGVPDGEAEEKRN